ncbi:hypothetical protein GCM10028803_30480 [Larkinella knui]|uniref:Tetratricopeptide repeat protein n=1 Tax=Larkinella knui TaxID=2025310 RepID=A0A3P1CYK1_9BACT|nr:sensor histidine kinase [Larkinella knui]RRB18076.1 tetratricopeptide repeat protein [Larkinella knui]
MKNLLLCLILVAHAGFSQKLKIDSLKRELRSLQRQPAGYRTDTLRGEVLKELMRAYSDVNIDTSAYYNAQLIKLCEDSKRTKELIYAYQYAGYLYQIRGNHHQSILIYYKALTLAEKLEQYARVVRCYSGLAHAYTSLKEYEKAITLCQQGLAVLGKHPDVTIQLSILNVLGAIYREQGKLDAALKVNQHLYKLARREHKSWFESQGMHAIGWVYQKMGKPTQALEYYKKALALCRQIGSVDLEGSILLHIAEVYVLQKNWPQALSYCTRARQTAVLVKNSGIAAESEETFYKIFKQTGQPARALKAHESYVQLKDSLSKENNQQRIGLLKADYDNIEKTNELRKVRVIQLQQENENQRMAQTQSLLFGGIGVIMLVAVLLYWNNKRLQAKNREIDRQKALLETAREQLADSNKTLEIRVEERTAELVKANRELASQNEKIKEAIYKGQTIERKRVALELHDNLSGLLSAVNMSIQSINPINLSESEQSVYGNLKHLIQNAYAEVRNISHNILPAELEREGLSFALHTLIDQLRQSLPLDFSLTITGLQNRLPVEIEFNIYSIVFELINNVIKHAKATTVAITLFRTDTGVDLSVMDDGIGLLLHQPKRGVGLQNIQTRLDSLGGTFNTVLPPEKGTWILIKIPIETVRSNGNVA